MPLTKRGKKVLRKFKREYGKIKGKKVFYAFIRKHPRRASSWHKKRH